MGMLEERVSFLEGQIVLLPQMIGQVGERLDRAEAALGQRIEHVEATLGQRIERVETTLGERIDRVETNVRAEIRHLGQRLDGRMDGLEDRMSKQFHWLLGIQITTFVTTLAAILGVFYGRG